MKKVLFMLSSMNVGGVEKSFLSLLSAMPKNKYDITLLLLEKKGGFLKDIPDWVTIEEAAWFTDVKPVVMQSPQTTVKSYFLKKEFSKIPSFIYSYIVSEKILKDRCLVYKHAFDSIPIEKRNFDVAIAYQGPTDTIDYYIANMVNAKKKITWVHFDVSKHTVNKKLYERMYKKFDHIFIVSNEAEKTLVQKIPSIAAKTEVFMNIISKNMITKLSKKMIDFDDQYTGAKIVTVGRLAKEKGQDLAIKVLAKLRNEGYEVRWYCIGDGKQRNEYEQLIKEYGLEEDFILIGSVANPYPYIAKANIYVQTSRHEGYCLTLAEARCLNKPIVTTAFKGATEQIKNGYNGLIADINVENLHEKIKMLLEGKKRCEDLTENLSIDWSDTTHEIKKLLTHINDGEGVS